MGLIRLIEGLWYRNDDSRDDEGHDMEPYEFIVTDGYMNTVKVALRRDTSEAWEAENPVLREGELGFDLDEGKIKRGDGVTWWTDLPWWAEILEST